MALDGCGRCGRPEREHQVQGGTEDLAVWAWLTGCKGFAVAMPAVDKVKRQARAPKQAPVCRRCTGRGHTADNCP